MMRLTFGLFTNVSDSGLHDPLVSRSGKSEFCGLWGKGKHVLKIRGNEKFLE